MTGTRPRYLIEGCEDEPYHDIQHGPHGTEPDYYAFRDQHWTFNRAMRWIEADNGTLICYTEGSLALTGEGRVADWFTDPANEVTHSAGHLRLAKRSARQREAVVLPGLQVNLEQTPVLEAQVGASTAPWQVCVLVKGRSGPPLVAGDWCGGAGSIRLDLATAWREKGYELRFAEVHIAVGVWTETPGTEATLTARLWLPARAAVVPALPVIRTSRVAADGLPLAAVVVSADGSLLGADAVSVTATVGGATHALACRGGVWETRARGLPPGEHLARFRASGEVASASELVVRVTDGEFIGYDPARHSLTRAGRVLGPLSGSYQGMAFVREVGTDREAIVQGQEEWDEWDREVPPGEHWHYWEAWTPAEAEARYRYLQENGWDLLHLCQHWGLWEKLDAGGHLAPHGAEQLALILRLAARHGLSLLQALSHYPYGGEHPRGAHVTRVWRQYLEAGFRDEDWQDPASAFTDLFHQYLREYVSLFRDETALLGMSTSGEGDFAAPGTGAGMARVNDTYRFVTGLDRQHLFVAEPIFRLSRLPAEHCQGWEPPLRGSRMYWMGEDLPAELDLGIEFKFLQLGDCFMGEGSWPCPPLYARLKGYAGTWCGTPAYRTRVRDSLYLGLVHRNPFMLTWDEQHTEDEHRILRELRERVDWSQPWLEAPVVVRVDGTSVGEAAPETRQGRHVLACYEDLFTTVTVAVRYVPAEAPVPSGAQLVLDAREPFAKPSLDAALCALSPLQVSPGYRAWYCWSQDRRTLIAYVCNSTHHECVEGRSLAGRWQRLPEPVPLTLRLGNLPPDNLCCRVYDLNDKCCVREEVVEGAAAFDLGATSHDFAVVIVPPHR